MKFFETFKKIGAAGTVAAALTGVPEKTEAKDGWAPTKIESSTEENSINESWKSIFEESKLLTRTFKYGPEMRTFPGYVQFCKEYSIFCDMHNNYKPDTNYLDTLSKETFSIIYKIQKETHEKFQDKSDQENYNEPERWTLPNGFADCEDYMLYKYLKILEAGFNPLNVHMLIVDEYKLNENSKRTSAKTQHVVLAVDFYFGNKKQTLILDNIHQEIYTLASMLGMEEYQLKEVSRPTKLDSGKYEVRFFYTETKN